MSDRNSLENLVKIDEFPVGRAFSFRNHLDEIEFGWVTGYAFNAVGELVFKVTYAGSLREDILHPSRLMPVYHYCE